MEDKELLESAAKAAGISIQCWHVEGYPVALIPNRGLWGWDPLADDGDALRLAVKLCMFDSSLFDAFKRLRLEETRLDPSSSDEAITRRAITRAAAAMAG